MPPPASTVPVATVSRLSKSSFVPSSPGGSSPSPFRNFSRSSSPLPNWRTLMKKKPRWSNSRPSSISGRGSRSENITMSMKKGIEMAPSGW
ncbi:MAG TPA: hypothetical protein VNJ70_18215 [Thermoanaerobaculia bacterium]|nr:hypothetical protein [Thermoanaerobaculia bacterium]